MSLVHTQKSIVTKPCNNVCKQFHQKVNTTTIKKVKKLMRKIERNTSLTISSFKRANFEIPPQPTFVCSKLTIETLEEGIKYVQN